MNYALFLMPEPISSSRSLSATSNLASISIDIPASSPSTKHQRTHSSDIAVDDPDVTRGLSTAEAQRRQSFWGPNDVTAVSRGPRVMLPKGKEGLALFMRSAVGSLQTLVRGSVVGKYVEQFRNPLILLLLGSAIVSLLLGQVENCVSITLAVLLVGTVAFVQEWRTERSLEALNRLAPPRCRVVRDGRRRELLASELVPGDVVELHTGDRVPADIRLHSSVDLETDESMLTGETKACRKQAPRNPLSRRPTDDATEQGDAIAEDELLMATLVRQGYGRGVVTATGSRTRFGRMYTLMQETEEKRSPLQVHLDRLGEQLSLYSLGIICIIALVGIIQRQPFMQIFTVAVSLAVAAIPEGLPIVATITLALGVLRLSRKNVIVRRLPAVEALGSVDVLCVDKTGTLTCNQLTVQQIVLFDERGNAHDYPMAPAPSSSRLSLAVSDEGEAMLTALALCNNAHLSGEDEWHGNAVDVAIRRYLALMRHQIDSTRWRQRSEEASFTSDRKFMAVQYQDGRCGENVYFVKGAPEILLPSTSDAPFYEQVELMYAKGLRVLAVASGSNKKSLGILGLVGMCDPPRPDIKETLEKLRRSGVRCIMVTGDSEQTARVVAKQVGWAGLDGSRGIISGDELDRILAKTDAVLGDLAIVYRASPEQKLSLVRTLQRQQHVVAMTGDGVNDAPALRMADIGIAMGRSGTDVARAAAQIILADDRLGSLVDGLEEGKAIFSNIRHFIRFQLSTSLAALALIATSMFTTNGTTSSLSMNAMQILLVNIIMDGPPAQSLGVEPVDPAALLRPPRPKSTPILSRPLLLRTVLTALHVWLGTLWVLHWEHAQAADSTRTFSVFVLFSITNAVTCRSSHRSIFSLGLFSNRMLLATSCLSLSMLLAIIYLPTLQTIFQTRPLRPVEFLLLLATAGSLIVVDELIKALCASRRPQQQKIPSLPASRQETHPLVVSTHSA